MLMCEKILNMTLSKLSKSAQIVEYGSTPYIGNGHLSFDLCKNGTSKAPLGSR
jgi:hypothetical protein